MEESVTRILQHPMYKACRNQIEAWEKNRIFCKHDVEHCLSVARIGEILNLKEEMQVPEELIYAAALLHDIGRHDQYETEIPHEKAAVPYAKTILMDCGYREETVSVILTAIANHRNREVKEERSLNGLLYRADKLSRACYACRACGQCNWKSDKKNNQLIV